MDQATNMETQLAEQTLQEPALAQSGSNVLRRHIKENPKKGAEYRMSSYNEIGAMNFAKGFLLAGGHADILHKIIVKEYDLDEATANWHIEHAQRWAVRARKALNCANGEK